MLRYYFHVRDESGVSRDGEGAEFSDIDAARAEARASACDLAAERLKFSEANSEQIVEIADATGSILETLAVETILK